VNWPWTKRSQGQPAPRALPFDSVHSGYNALGNTLQRVRAGDLGRDALKELAEAYEMRQLIAVWDGQLSLEVAKARSDGARELLNMMLEKEKRNGQ
jgi:hypothetical protein